jgi:hypothetical protein
MNFFVRNWESCGILILSAMQGSVASGGKMRSQGMMGLVAKGGCTEASLLKSRG